MTVDERLARLYEPHVLPLMRLIKEIRQRGVSVPNIEPNDGGVNATIAFLLETPGPRAVASNFVSFDNDDPSARNMKYELNAAGFNRKSIFIWNVVPYCISTETKNKNASAHQIVDAAPDTRAFLALLPELKAVVFCGRSAQRAERHLSLPPNVKVFKTYHPALRSYRQPHCKADISRTFTAAFEYCAKPSFPRIGA
ncbi:MAG TPA: uracil-DNA glycosylase [Rhizomicrobium sp.]|nr:uracil-DNA glycosylase [Rhizomicrobium sp.]